MGLWSAPSGSLALRYIPRKRKMRNVNQAPLWFRLLFSVCIVGSIFGIKFDSHANDHKTERQYPIPGHGVLKLNVPKLWRDGINQPPNNLPPTIILKPESGNSFLIGITAMWSPTQEVDFNKPSKIKHAMEQKGQGLLPKSDETELNLQGLRGPSCWGYYFSLTDKAPKPGEFKYLTQGSLGLGDLLLSFTILANDNKSKAIHEAKTMLRSARQEILPQNIKIVRKYQCGMLNFKMFVILGVAAGLEFKEIRDIPGEYEILLDNCNIIAKEKRDGIEVQLTAEDSEKGKELLDALMKNAEEFEVASPTINISKREREEKQAILNELMQEIKETENSNSK